MNNRLLPILVLVLTISLVACGGDSPTGGSTIAPADAGPEDSAATTTTTAQLTETTEGGADQPDSGQEVAKSGGRASITLVGATVEFDTFTCYFGDAAVDAFGDDDLTFGALGQLETSAGTPTLAVSTVDSALGPNHTIFFSPIGGTDLAWQLVGSDAVVFDGDRITGEGDFTKIVDGAPTEGIDFGTFEATCGS